MEDFNTRTSLNPETNTTTVVVEFPQSQKIYQTTIKNRAFPDETQALINNAIYKLVFQVYLQHMSKSVRHQVSEQVKEKLEEKNIELVGLGRPKMVGSKNNLTEERKQYCREKASQSYYNKKQHIAIRA